MDAFESALLEHWQTDAAHDIAHIHRVWSNAQAIAQKDALEVEQDVLRAATVFHDLVNLPKDAPNRAVASRLSAQAADPILADLGMSAVNRAKVAHAITAHSYSAGIPPETDEARILRDADRLDALGAIGIARMMAVSGALGRAIYDPNDPFAAGRALDDTRWSIDHFETKLFRLADDMLTKTGRRIATDRTRYMRAYLKQLTSEM